MARPPRAREPDALTALNQLRILHSKLTQERLDQDERRARKYATAIQACLDRGLSLRDVAVVLNVSPETVRKMARAG